MSIPPMERTGIEESLIDAYLMGEISRDAAMKGLGSEKLAEVEYQRDCIKRDFEWGKRGT